MQTGSGAKNPPWARSNVNSNITGINPQIMDPNAMMSQQSIMPFQQTAAVFNPGMMQTQSGMAMSMGGQMPLNQMAQGQMYPGNVVAYPTPRAMNPNMYQNTANQAPQGNEQRVFTGTVTKTHNDFGFVDHDVFYQISVCAKGVIPKVNDRVLVEATYNPNMPFKWNATRVQVLPKNNPNQKGGNSKPNNYAAVPPPNKKPMMIRRNDDRRDDRSSRRDDRKRSRSRSRSRSRDRRDSRNRRDSPPRKRPIVHQPSPVKYMVRVPKMPLDIQKMDVPAISQRYSNLYIPSDFFNAHVKWGETFPPQSPFSLNSSCQYHILDKTVSTPHPNDAVLEPPDADYRFSAKVMLISMPTLESLYQKCGLTKVDEKDKRSSKSPLHPTRLIKFLVGQKGKGTENFAIGGPWSPSLDGEKPESDPGVLVKTAIRTCKALTGIDLSECTQWYRMVEFYYWRESGGKSRLECVVLFLPDVWAVQLAGAEWAGLGERYKATEDAALRALCPDAIQSTTAEDIPERSQIENQDLDSTITIDENDDDEAKLEPTHYSKIDLRTIKVDALRHELRARGVSCKGIRSQLISRLSKLFKGEQDKDTKGEEIMEVEDDDEQEKTSDKDVKETKPEATKDEEVKEIEAEEKKEERTDKPDKKEEERKDDKDTKDVKDDKEKKDDKVKKEKPKTEKEIEEDKKKLEKEKQMIKSRYELPTTPHIIVHPSATAKGGKFGCSVATLSLLLDYRVTDNKEHSFELFVFAELFNEMLMRDFGFYIYKTLYTLPEKAEEIKDEKKDDKKEEKKDEKEDVKKEDEDKKKEDKDKEDKDKKDDKRDARRRDRRDSHSDDERSKSPRRRSRGVDLPADPYLLLSLVYFDTARGGTVSRKDLQSLFISLGLQLSRSQIRAVLEKVCVRDNFSYKPLIQTLKDLGSGADSIQDLSLDSAVSTEEPPHVADLESVIASGNRNLLPVFAQDSTLQPSTAETKDVSDTGLVSYKSRIVDVGALVNSAAKWQAERARLQTALEQAQAALKAARATAASTQQAERGAKSQLSDLNADLAAARARITSLMASSKIFHAALKSIKSKADAVVNIKYEDDDVVEVVNGPAKEEKESESKQKEVKVEIKEEVKDKDVKKDKDIISTENMDLDDKE
ncbi:cell division cycle and apoptosis regulator protein 1-like [Pieris brassicae]|uniref:cell division cycle and apoptosis regulator protein 1-like n=1 Tax=Pieris brassicae TaxID=7116 RepID=UPI001E6609B4|nr:cell division cycle and apoptosis regulator protein 1-like [Pieris brassicae]